MHLRPASLDDAEAVYELLVARDLADLGFRDVTLGDVLEELRSARIDLARDTRVAELSDEIRGYAIVRPEGSLGVTHPKHEGHGIGSQLLSWTEERERERGQRPHRQWFASTNQRARDLISSAGYHHVRSYFRMSLELGNDVRALAPPIGVSLRSLDVAGDAERLHELDNRSFAALPDYRPELLEEFVEEHLRAHDLDPGCSRVATRDGEIVGFLLARRWAQEQVGYVDVLAVDPAHQGQGIGPAMLRSAFALFTAAGLTSGQLGVACDNPRGLEVYRRAGMTPRFRFDTYERALEPGAQLR